MGVLELKLYRAHCHADGCSEGNFNAEDMSEAGIERHRKAMETVDRYLRSRGGDLIIEAFSGVANSEQEARELLGLCWKEMPDANLIVRLSSSEHGRIVFDRKIEFGKHGLEDRASLIEKMQDWEYMKTHEVSADRLLRAFYLDSEFSGF
jgi:hypothetical protein